MAYILFRNKGLLNKLDIVTIGSSEKRNNSKLIGEYGSGLKYAICGMISHSIQFRIFSGEEEFVCTEMPISNGEKSKNVLVVNGEKSSIAIDIGHKWKPWMYLRELFSNCADENGTYEINDKDISSLLRGEFDETLIAVEISSVIREVIDKWHLYFCDKKEKIDEISDGSQSVIIYKADSDDTRIYKNGILIYTDTKKSLFHYDWKDAEIDEMRLLRDTWELRYALGKLITISSNIEFIEEFLKSCNNNNTFESSLQLTSTFSQEWISLIKDILAKKSICSARMEEECEDDEEIEEEEKHEIEFPDETRERHVIADNLLTAIVKNNNLCTGTTVSTYQSSGEFDLTIIEADNQKYNSKISLLLDILNKSNLIEYVKIQAATINSPKYKFFAKNNSKIIYVDFDKKITDADYWQLVKAYYSSIMSCNQDTPWKLFTEKILYL